jgi:hypothetical protein
MLRRYLHSRQWIISRRIALIAVILILGFRQYGDPLLSRFRGPHPDRDIVITRAEFRPELPGAKPAWIIGFRNDSDRFTYDQIQLRATYLDDKGTVLETDTLLVKQKLPPGDEKIIGSVDFKDRGPATQGNLTVLGAQEVR